MQYMLLIYDEEQQWAALGEQERGKIFQEYGDYTRELQESGAMVAGDALQATSTSTTVEYRDGKTLTTDGPFAETKEQLGGYYLIDVDTIDEAIEWAARIPSARHFGKVEVRPVMQVTAPSEAGAR